MLNRIGMRQLQSEAYTLRLMRRIHGSYPYQDGTQTGVFYTAAENVASYARQAIAYAAAADAASIEIVPVVRYYQMLHTIKTLLYLFKLDFPTSTSVLRHGLSVRRIKRSGYRWPLEKLTVHKEGIIQSFHQLLSHNRLPDKLLVGDLIGSLPQLAGILGQFYDHLEHAYPLYSTAVQSPTTHNPAGHYPAAHNPGPHAAERSKDAIDETENDRVNNGIDTERKIDNSVEFGIDSAPWYDVSLGDSFDARMSNPVLRVETGANYQSEWGWVSRRIASNQGMTIDEWKRSYLNAGKVKHAETHVILDSHVPLQESSEQVQGFFHLDAVDYDVKGYLQIPLPETDHPWFNSYDGVDYLVDEPAYPVYMVHYGLLYGLSALSRYSATEWSDIIHWNNEQDALLVREYLRLPFPRPLIRLDDPVTPQSIEWVASGHVIND